MENEKLAREVETQAIFLARQIILLDLNFFKNNKTIYQKYDFFHKFQDYTLSGKSLSYTILKEYPIDKLYHLLKSINSINNFIRIDLPLNFNEQILTELNKDLKNIIEISNENIYKLFKNAKIVIGTASGTAIEAVACGISVVIIASKDNLTANPLIEVGKGKIWDIVYDIKDLEIKIKNLLEYRAENKTEIKNISKWYKDNFFVEPTKENITKVFEIR